MSVKIGVINIISFSALCSLYVPKIKNFGDAFMCYKQKCKVVSLNLAHPVLDDSKFNY